MDEVNTLPFGTEAQSIARHNAETSQRWREEEKKREAEIAQRKREWLATPDSERICTVCGLGLSPVDIARITQTLPALRHHDFCNPFDAELNGGIAKGLVSLLSDLYGEGEEVPLEAAKKVFETWKSQRGRCYISQVLMSFPVEEKPITPMKRPSLVDPLHHATMERQRQKEQADRVRAGELYQPVIVLEEDGSIRLISKTVQKWREGLSDSEFTELIRVIHSRLPELQKKEILDFKTSARSTIRRRGY